MAKGQATHRRGRATDGTEPSSRPDSFGRLFIALGTASGLAFTLVAGIDFLVDGPIEIRLAASGLGLALTGVTYGASKEWEFPGALALRVLFVLCLLAVAGIPIAAPHLAPMVAQCPPGRTRVGLRCQTPPSAWSGREKVQIGQEVAVEAVVEAMNAKAKAEREAAKAKVARAVSEERAEKATAEKKFAEAMKAKAEREAAEATAARAVSEERTAAHRAEPARTQYLQRWCIPTLEDHSAMGTDEPEPAMPADGWPTTYLCFLNRPDCESMMERAGEAAEDGLTYLGCDFTTLIPDIAKFAKHYH